VAVIHRFGQSHLDQGGGQVSYCLIICLQYHPQNAKLRAAVKHGQRFYLLPHLLRQAAQRKLNAGIERILPVVGVLLIQIQP
jgi:hypothetical protein